MAPINLRLSLAFMLNKFWNSFFRAMGTLLARDFEQAYMFTGWNYLIRFILHKSEYFLRFEWCSTVVMFITGRWNCLEDIFFFNSFNWLTKLVMKLENIHCQVFVNVNFKKQSKEGRPYGRGDKRVTLSRLEQGVITPWFLESKLVPTNSASVY